MISFIALALAFGEGLALIFSPCILPVLPLMLGASLDGNRARPLGIVIGFVIAFTLFALLSRQAILASGIDGEAIRNISLFLLAGFGLVMLLPSLSDRWTAKFQNIGSGGNDLISRIQGQGFWSGVAIGALIGIVWTPCAGPILGAAILQIIQAQSQSEAMMIIAAFALGAGIPMFAIALSGRYLMSKLGFLKRHSYAIRRIAGIIMIAAALTIFSGLDLKLVAWQASTQAQSENDVPEVKDALSDPVPAPEITGITDWLNSNPLTLAQLRGKVILIDFWTYSCINCIRTMPYLTKWYEKYKDDGFVIIGVHAPEFPFEKKLSNVKDAVKQYGITYPVALDNNFSTWRAYENRYWPAHYLIDRDGRVIYTHFGEGHYDITENNIRALLNVKGVADVTPEQDVSTRDQSPETYLGYERAKNFASPENVLNDATQSYSFPLNLDRNEWALSGSWMIGGDKIVAGDDAALRYNFRAGKVHLVLGSPDGRPIRVDVMLDGKAQGAVGVTGERLYTIINLPEGAQRKGLLEIRPERPGLEAYAFTFGK